MLHSSIFYLFQSNVTFWALETQVQNDLLTGTCETAKHHGPEGRKQRLWKLQATAPDKRLRNSKTPPNFVPKRRPKCIAKVPNVTSESVEKNGKCCNLLSIPVEHYLLSLRNTSPKWPLDRRLRNSKTPWPWGTQAASLEAPGHISWEALPKQQNTT